MKKSSGISYLFTVMVMLSTITGHAQKNARTVTGRFYLDGTPVAVTMQEGRITRVAPLPVGTKVPELFVAPGLIDIQINGYMGIDFTGDTLTTEGVGAATRALWKEGVTTYLPTVITNSFEHQKKNFRILAQARKDPDVAGSVPGFHLEGPYINPEKGYRGAHLAKYIRPAGWDEFEQLQQAAGGGIRLITVAPEMEGAIPFIRQAVMNGIRVSLGHHNGSAEDIKKAADAGATLCTHLGNGCANTINRHHNPLWPQLAEERLSISIIVDGYHLTPEEVKTFYQVKGNAKTILISDMLDLAGLTPGEYTRGERKVLLTPHVIKFPEENVLAGAASTLRMDAGNMMRITGCSLKEAIQMASTNPAVLLDLEDRGRILPGYRADLILFTVEKGEIKIQKTLVAGKTVYEKSETLKHK